MPKSDKSTSTEPRVADCLQKALALERQTPQFSDLTVEAGGVEFQCHRLILAAISGFFRSLLSSGMRESTERRVQLQGIPSDVFTDVLRWIYDGSFILSLENVFDVLPAADQLDIHSLLSECRDFLEQNLSVDNCVSIYNISGVYPTGDLNAKSRSFLLKNFNSVCSSEEFFKLSAEDLKSLVADPELVTRSEDAVIESILRWVKADARPVSNEYQGRKCTTDGELGSSTSNTKGLTESGKDLGCKEDETGGTTDPTDDLDKTCSLKGGLDNADGTTASVGIGKEENIEQHSRIDVLPKLLEATRYLLASSNCVCLTLATEPLVQADQRCRAIQEEMLHHKTRLDRHQNEWMPPASLRMNNELRDVVLTCFTNRLYCKLRWNDPWYELNVNLTLKAVTNLVYYDSNIYIRNQSKMLSVFIPRYTSWHGIMGIPQVNVVTVAMFPVGDELISVYKFDGETYAVESLDLKKTGEAAWKEVGKLSMRGMEVASVTNIGSRLIIFWKQGGQSRLSIECFDMVRRESSLLQDQLCSSSGLVTFKHGDQAFALQQNGALWRICAQTDAPYVNLRLEMWVWNFHRAVGGAMLVKGELWVFDTTPKSDGDPATEAEEEKVCLEGVFKDVKFCFVSTHQTGFVHAVVPANLICSS